MRPSHAGKVRLFGIGLATLLLAVASCRVGYEELPLGLDAAGSSGAESSGGTSAAGSTGATAGIGQGNAGLGGGSAQTPDGGAGNASDAGAPGLGGAGNVAGETGFGGAPGDCQNTANCTCELFDSRVYWFCLGPAMYAEAGQRCGTQNMLLARVDSQAENDFVQSTAAQDGLFVADTFVFFGANDQGVAGEWRWADGTQFWQGDDGGMAVDGLYEHWNNASPSSSSIKRCGGMMDIGEWQNRSCTAVEGFVCEQ